jgi:hypothetical protein
MRKRNQIAGQFVAHPRQMIESVAWRVLSLAARKALERIEIEHMDHGGAENGRLPVTYADFETWDVHPNFVAPALRELEALGFIEIVKRGSRGAAGTRQASEYRLTFRPAWNAPKNDTGSHEYMKIKTREDAEAVASAARKRADPQTVTRAKESILSPSQSEGTSPSLSEGKTPVSRPHKVRVQARPHKLRVPSILSGVVTNGQVTALARKLRPAEAEIEVSKPFQTSAAKKSRSARSQRMPESPAVKPAWRTSVIRELHGEEARERRTELSVATGGSST